MCFSLVLNGSTESKKSQKNITIYDMGKIQVKKLKKKKRKKEYVHLTKSKIGKRMP